jgi:endonuclease/exonuclease/phosphatase family metal-dependent hydrolase
MAPCPEDDVTENAWIYRLPKVSLLFSKYLPDIIGVQEISKKQTISFTHLFNTKKWGILTRTPNRPPFESGLGIIYNATRLAPLSPLHTIWLNEKQDSPDAPAWDGSDYERFAIYAQFKDLTSGIHFWFLTTHFDHIGVQARTESAKIVMNLAQQLNGPTIITGDFNCFPQLGGAQLYQLLCSHVPSIQDSRQHAKHIFGVDGSWIGWEYDQYRQKEGHAKYDHIFVKQIATVLQHGIIDDQVEDQQLGKTLYPSDHRPVISDIKF